MPKPRASVRVQTSNRAGSILALLAAPKVTKAAALVVAAQRARIPVSKDGSYGNPPGYARERIAARPTVSLRGGLAFNIGSDATTPEGFPYPVVLDRGSGPHTITAHGNYPLRNPRTGQVFGKTVHHPGTRPTYWCTGSVEVLRGMRL